MAGSLSRHPDFRRLWAGQTVSAFGSVVSREAIPLAALLVLGAGPVEMGILVACASIGVLLTSLVAGVWVDRVRRRRLLIAADLGRAVLLFGIPAAGFAGVLRVEQLYLVAFLAAALGAVFDIAYRSYLPSLVGRERIVEGNARLGMSDAVAEVGGPGLTGALVQVFSAPLAVLVDACSFLVSAVSLGSIRTAEPAPAPGSAGRSMRREIIEGLAIVARDPLLRATTASAASRAFFGSFIGALYALYALRVLGLTPFVLGALISSGGIGSLVGAFAAQRLMRRLGLGPALIATALVGALLTFLIPLASGPPAAAALYLLIGQLLGDALFTIHGIGVTSLRQLVTPDWALGRMNATVHLLLEGVAPFGAVVGAGIAAIVDPRFALTVAAAGILASAAFLVWSPVRHAGRRATLEV